MKKILLFSTSLLLTVSIFAQNGPDSVSMNPGYTTDVYYSMKNGIVDSSNNSSWHFAFAVRPSLFPNNTLQSTSVRINEARGVSVKKSGFTVAQWSTFDTAGLAGWTSLHDNDSSWDLSAFNAGLNISAYNYGWGSYDPGSHDVIGTNIYLVKIKNGTSYDYKKFMISRLVFDSQWVFTFSNLDGTDSNTVKITKSAYANKLFAYYNFTNKTQFNREPNANTWDVVFAYYSTPVFLGPPPAVQYAVAGVLSNPLSPSARVTHVDKVTTTPVSVGLVLNAQANNIDWSWSVPPMGPPPADYALIDSMVFFVKSQADSKTYKLYFTKFTTSDPGKFVFNKTVYTPTTGIADLNTNENTFGLYPNPATSAIRVNLSGKVNEASLHIYDLTGKMVLSKTFSNAHELNVDLDGLNKGIYFMTLEADGVKQAKKFIVE